MHALLQPIIAWYFGILGQFGLFGVVALMTMESSIFPIPSEIVVPPAAVVYLKTTHIGGAWVLIPLVILAGTLGSLIGASITYGLSRWLGRPLVLKYGKYVLISERKLERADEWMLRYGAGGVFIGRLLPGVRQGISVAAGVIGMRYRTFALMTTLGAGLWCSVLTGFGILMSKDMQVLINNHGRIPSAIEEQALNHAMMNLTLALLALVVAAMLFYWLLARLRSKQTAGASAKEPTPNA